MDPFRGHIRSFPGRRPGDGTPDRPQRTNRGGRATPPHQSNRPARTVSIWDIAALTIQRVFRGYCVRKKYQVQLERRGIGRLARIRRKELAFKAAGRHGIVSGPNAMVAGRTAAGPPTEGLSPLRAREIPASRGHPSPAVVQIRESERSPGNRAPPARPTPPHPSSHARQSHSPSISTDRSSADRRHSLGSPVSAGAGANRAQDAVGQYEAPVLRPVSMSTPPRPQTHPSQQPPHARTVSGPHSIPQSPPTLPIPIPTTAPASPNNRSEPPSLSRSFTVGSWDSTDNFNRARRGRRPEYRSSSHASGRARSEIHHVGSPTQRSTYSGRGRNQSVSHSPQHSSPFFHLFSRPIDTSDRSPQPQSPLSAYHSAHPSSSPRSATIESTSALRVLLEGSHFLGSIDVSATSTLEDARESICMELDAVPQDFVFVQDDVPVGRNQEHKRLATNYLPCVTVRETPCHTQPPAVDDIRDFHLELDKHDTEEDISQPHSAHLPSTHTPPGPGIPHSGSYSFSPNTRLPPVLTDLSSFDSDLSIRDGEQSAPLPLSRSAYHSSHHGHAHSGFHGHQHPTPPHAMAASQHATPRAISASPSPLPGVSPALSASPSPQSFAFSHSLYESHGPTPSPMGLSVNHYKPPTVSVMFSAPLAYLGDDKQLHTMPLVDHEVERDLICKSFEEAGKDIELTFGFATTDYLRSVVTRGCKILHYSGHANPQVLSFEDGFAGVHFVRVAQLRSLFAAGGAEGKPELCVVSACSSRVAGEAFLEAGVKHAVCVELEVDVLDRSATIFTRAFYLALIHGKTVKASFDIACEAVKASPGIDGSEANKFLLLPKEDVHNVSMFPSNLPSIDWQQPPPLSLDSLPPPPEGFLGRTLDMYMVAVQILRHRLITICGPNGCGKTAVALAVANYLSERRSFREGVYFISLAHSYTLQQVYVDMARELKIHEPTEDAIMSFLQRRNCLLIWDYPRLDSLSPVSTPSSATATASSSSSSSHPHESHAFASGASPRSPFPNSSGVEIRMFLSRMLEHTRGVKFIVVTEKPISTKGPLFGAPEKVHELQPLEPLDAARLLIRRAPRRIDPEELGCTTYTELYRRLSRHPYLRSLEYVPGRIVEAALQLRTLKLHQLPSSSAPSRPSDPSSGQAKSRRFHYHEASHGDEGSLSVPRDDSFHSSPGRTHQLHRTPSSPSLLSSAGVSPAAMSLNPALPPSPVRSRSFSSLPCPSDGAASSQSALTANIAPREQPRKESRNNKNLRAALAMDLRFVPDSPLSPIGHPSSASFTDSPPSSSCPVSASSVPADPAVGPSLPNSAFALRLPELPASSSALVHARATEFGPASERKECEEVSDSERVLPSDSPNGPL